MITWRQYRASDEAALRRAHARQCAALAAGGGEPFAFPPLDDPRYLMVEVAERDGMVVLAVAAHATVEMMLIGGDAPTVGSAIRRRQHFRARLRAAGCDEAHAFAARALERPMAALLARAGFRPSSQGYVPYYTEI